jgi:hypothetical protein
MVSAIALTEMKIEARIQSHESVMLDNVLRSFESAFVLVAGSNSSSNSGFGNARVVTLGHQD